MHAPRHPRPFTPLILALFLAVSGAASCDHASPGSAPEAEEAGSLYSLDPPELGLTAAPGFTDGVPVLCYHYFRSGLDAGYLLKVLGSVIFGMPALGPREFWTTPLGEFEKHLQYFRDSGTQVMTLDEVAEAVAAGRPLPRRAVVLTIDDADQSVYRLAWPLLRKYNMRAHLFVPTGHVGRKWDELKVCSWDQLREMSESGFVLVGSHTRDLHYKIRTPRGLEPAFWNPELISAQARQKGLSALARQQRLGSAHLDAAQEAALGGRWAPVATDLLASRLQIARNVGSEAEWLAWPYVFEHGTLDSISRVAGFRGTVSLAPRSFSQANGGQTSGRYTLTAKTTLELLRTVVEPQ
jgi:peptidoglycan/xylan/chitin deacetylase (PgdA/CDA1 family)